MIIYNKINQGTYKTIFIIKIIINFLALIYQDKEIQALLNQLISLGN